MINPGCWCWRSIHLYYLWDFTNLCVAPLCKNSTGPEYCLGLWMAYRITDVSDKPIYQIFCKYWILVLVKIRSVTITVPEGVLLSGLGPARLMWTRGYQSTWVPPSTSTVQWIATHVKICKVFWCALGQHAWFILTIMQATIWHFGPHLWEFRKVRNVTKNLPVWLQCYWTIGWILLDRCILQWYHCINVYSIAVIQRNRWYCCLIFQNLIFVVYW